MVRIINVINVCAGSLNQRLKPKAKQGNTVDQAVVIPKLSV